MRVTIRVGKSRLFTIMVLQELQKGDYGGFGDLGFRAVGLKTLDPKLDLHPKGHRTFQPQLSLHPKPESRI